MNDHIAVIIPCFNHAYVLRRTLKALTKQTVQPAEVVVVDDCSTDDPELIVNEFNKKLPIKFLRFRHNRGAPAARNEGAKETVSPYLLFLDADAELVPDALEAMMKALEDRPETDFAYADFYWGRKRFRGREFDPDQLKKRNWIHTSSLIRRSVFPGFDETLKKFQDWDLWLTLAKQGVKGVWIDRPLFRIEPRRRGTGMSFWLPSIAHRLPWPMLGWMPSEIRRYREAEQILRTKHSLTKA
jgi:glycosyltransferase involved in cell wall biosynthesis